MPIHGELQTVLDSGPAAAVNALAKAHGFVTWNIDPVFANASSLATVVTAGGVFLAKGDVVQGIAIPVATAGVTMTFGGVGIYDANLNLLASANTNGAQFQSTGWIKTDLSAPFTVPASGLYYLASGFTGGTNPSVLTFTQSIAMSTTPGGLLPRGVKGSAPAGAMPSNIASVGQYTVQPVLAAY